MASQKTTEYLLKIQTDLSGAEKLIKAQKLIQTSIEATGRKFDKISQILKVNTEQVQQKNGSAYLKLDAIYKKTDGTVEKLTAKLNANGTVLNNNAKNVSIVTTHFNKLAGGTVGLIGHLGNLAKRAFSVIIVWQGLRTIFQTVGRVISDSIQFFVDFEAALADIQIASDASREEIQALGTAILEVSKKFGVGFKDATEGAVILAQQGKTTTEIIETLGPALQLSVVSGRSLKDIIEDLTAIQTAYNLTGEDTVRITDAIQQVQSKFTISTADLAAGLRRVGPVAAQLGVTFEETIGLITAVQGATRRSGEAVGNSLRTILTRLQGDTLQTIQAIGQVPAFLDAQGKATFKVTATNRDLIPILTDLAKNWDNLTITQKNQLATTVAGRTQVTAFLALMGEFSVAVNASQQALNSQGATLRATGIVTETVKNKVAQLTTGWQAFLDAIGNSSGGGAISSFVKGTLDALITATDFYTDSVNKNRKSLADYNKENKTSAQLLEEKTKKLKAETDAKAESIKTEGNRATILDSIGERERELLEKNASDLQIIIEKRRLLFELSKKAGFVQDGIIDDPALKKKDENLQKDQESIKRKRELNQQNLENESSLKALTALGFNDLEIQVRRIDLEKQKADEIARTTGLAADYTKVQEEQIKLQDILNQKINESANEFKGLLQNGLKDFLLGSTENTFSNFTKGIRESFASSTATGLSDLVSKSGISKIFGELNTGLAGAFSGVNSGPFKGITQAHVAAMPFVTQAIVNAHQKGVVSAGAATSGGNGGQGGFLGALGNFNNPGALGLAGAVGLGALGGLSGGPFRSSVGNSIFGGISAGISAINPALGAVVSVAGSLFSLFRKPKRTVDVREEERSFQVASKIEVTNNKLDIVNRNLVAIKGALETFVLPDSAFFSTKRNLEDNFALNQRRGLG